jgi:two-component system sensor histidine kinase TctE
VRVAIEAAADTAALSVTDEGPGIPEAEREQVFQRFYRVLGTAQSGTGLGLSIVERIVHTHGGKVELDAADGGKGLRVRVRLPRGRARR